MNNQSLVHGLDLCKSDCIAFLKLCHVSNNPYKFERRSYELFTPFDVNNFYKYTLLCIYVYLEKPVSLRNKT